MSYQLAPFRQAKKPSKFDSIGGMAERLKAPVLKIGRVQKALVGSNPTPSVFPAGMWVAAECG